MSVHDENNARAILALGKGWTVVPDVRGRQHDTDTYRRNALHI